MITVENFKNLFHWRFHLFYNYKVFKKILIILIFSIITHYTVITQTRQPDDFSALITKITSQDQTKPSRSEGENFVELNEQDKINSGTTILTSDTQNVEIILYKNTTPTAIILIKENTDLKISYNFINNTQDLFINYGAIRVVTNNNINTVINSETVTSSCKGIDLGFVSITDKIVSKKSGYIIVFGGEAVITSKLNSENSENIEALFISEFENDKISSPRKFINEELQEWKETSLYQTSAVPHNVNLVLEKLELTQKEKQSSSLDENKKLLLSHLLTFETGVISYNKDIGPKFVFRPEITSQNGKFHFGLYLPVNIIPNKILTDNRFFKVNRNNNEWSFGTDIQYNILAKSIDIVDDILLKINSISYNHIEDNFFISFGDFFNVSDFNNYSLVGFNSKIFYPMQRKSSFVINFKTKLLDGLIYAEDVLPKGLYGTDLVFKTPNKIFKSEFRLSAFLDCYDLIPRYMDESFFPAQINTTYNLLLFDVTSIGFSFYLSNGVLLPLSYDYNTKSSSFTNLMLNNPFAILASLTANAGLSLRAKDFNLSSELILESGTNKVGLFDTYYIANRENRTSLLKEWMESMSSRSINVSDYKFGFRFIVKYNLLKHLALQSSYQVTFPGYFDKLFFKIELDSLDKWKVNCSFYAEWLISRIGFTFQSFEFFQENNILYLGFKISPFPGFDIHINGGMYPDSFKFFSPYNSNFLLDCYILYKPLFSYLKLKNKKFTPRTKKEKSNDKSVRDIFDKNQVSP